uniref:Uncharacterized protein n=1 Tax=viral metagenome TaxID=1070528 RepID=A0A6C0K0B3_9ZZZZ
MYSIVFTAALFMAIILNDLIQKHKNRVAIHSFFGLLATGLIAILWYLEYEVVGWTLILVPIAALIISYIVVATGASSSVTATAAPAPTGIMSGTPSAAASAASTCSQYNPPGPYTTMAPGTVSLPATTGSQPTTAPPTVTVPPPPPSTATSQPNFTITPITSGC